MYVFCSKALAEALNIPRKELKKIPDTEIVDAFYSWHGHIAKVQGKNTIVLMNDKTMYSLIFRNNLPRKAEKLVGMILEAIAFTMEVGGLNYAEIEKYLEGIGEIVLAEKPERQMTGNLTRMMLDMEYTGHRWFGDETVQANQAAFENNLLRKLDDDYIKPFELMLDELTK